MTNLPAITDHILVLILGIVIPFISGVRSHESMKHIEFDSRTRKRFFIVNSITLALMAGVVLVIWWLHQRPLAEMGFRPLFSEGKKIYWWLTGILVIQYLADTVYSVATADELSRTKERWESSVPFLPRKLNELPAYTLMCVSAGVCEEIMYRGFMVTYFMVDFSYPTSFPILAALIPAVLFSLAHYYQGAIAVIKILLLSVLLGMIFILSGSLWIVIIIHFGIDLLGGVLAMILYRKSESRKVRESEVWDSPEI
jgi:uncharacterized protein